MFKARFEALDVSLAGLEAAVPFILTQSAPPTQIDWESAWVAAGNTLPIPVDQELYWFDGVNLRGEYRNLLDQYRFVTPSKTESFEIQHMLWGDGDAFYAQVLRNDTNGDWSLCKVYMDGTLEDMTFGGALSKSVLSYPFHYDPDNRVIYYMNNTSFIRRHIDTFASSGGLTMQSGNPSLYYPDSRFIAPIPDASGDFYFGGRKSADATARLYYYDFSGGTGTSVLTTFNPGTGSVTANKPMAVTTDYVFCGETVSRAAFDGIIIHQIARSGYTYVDTIDLGITADEIQHVVIDTDYANNIVYLVVGHVLPGVNFLEWSKVYAWDADTGTATIVDDLPYLDLLQTLRAESGRYREGFHVTPNLYYRESFTVDGGDESHYHNIGIARYNPDKTKLLIHDLNWHTWTNTEHSDIWVYGNTDKIYRISDWEQTSDDVIMVAQGELSGNGAWSVDISNVPPDYRLFDIAYEVYGSSSTLIDLYSFGEPSSGAHMLYSTNVVALTGSSSGLRYSSELTTNGSVYHLLVFRDNPSLNHEAIVLFRQSARTTSATAHHVFNEGVEFRDISDLETLTLTPKRFSNMTNCRYVIRAWRTRSRNTHSGGDYDPSMA